MDKTEPRPHQEPDTTGREHEGEASDGGVSGDGEEGRVGVVRRKRRVKGQKVCGVCGDVAMSHNFGALTCETCKAFFRRNAHKQKEIPACVFQNNCSVSKATRRFCAACRLKKCFAIGMTADLILDNEEKKARRNHRKAELACNRHPSSAAHLENNQATLQHQTTPSPPSHHQATSSYHSTVGYQQVDINPIVTAATGTLNSPGGYLEKGVNQAATHLTPSPGLQDRLSPISSVINRFYDTTGLPTTSIFTVPVSRPGHYANSTVPKTEPEPSEQARDTRGHISLSVTQLQQAHTAGVHSRPQYMSTRPLRSLGTEFQHVAREELPWDIKLYWPLTNDERHVLMRLNSAYQDIMMTLTAPEEGETPSRSRQARSIVIDDVMFALDYSLRKCVRFSKAIPEFQQLKQTDQIAALKAAAMQLTTIRASAFYVPERRMWLTVYGDASLSEVLELFAGDPAPAMFAAYCEALKSVVKNDSTLYALLHAIALFDARDDTLDDRVLINTLRDRYIVLLKHHLEAQFSFLHADRYLVEMLDHLVDLRHLAHNVMAFYRQYSHLFKPLLTEIFTR